MTTILTRTSTYEAPYIEYNVQAETSKRLPDSVRVTAKVTAKIVSGAETWGDGVSLVAGFYDGNQWHTFPLKSLGKIWNNTSSYSETYSFTVHDLSASASSISVKFRCMRNDNRLLAGAIPATSCNAISITNIAQQYADLKITGAATQHQARITLSNVPIVSEYDRTIKWYRGNLLVTEVSVPRRASATSYTMIFNGLSANTRYTFGADIVYDDILLKSRSVSVTTPIDIGEMSVRANSTYVKAVVSKLADDLNQVKTVEFYYKQKNASIYELFGTVETQEDSITKNITGLLTETEYDIKVQIKIGENTAKTLTESVVTTGYYWPIPTADIESISQEFGTRECTINWIVDREIAGTKYFVEIKKNGESTWERIKTFSKVESPIVVESPVGNEFITFRIAATNASIFEEMISHSNEVRVYVQDEFLWDSEKVAGQPFEITANEWNRLREYAIALNKRLGNTVDIPFVSKDTPITASAYNNMKAAISLIEPIDIQDKRRGDAIKASDIDALRIAINTIA